MDKLKEAESLVDTILFELSFDAGMATSNATGHFNVNWTECFKNKCSGMELSFDKDICKQACIISAASASISEIAGMRSLCGEVKKPSSCLKRLDKGVKKLQEKIKKAREKQREIRDKKALYLRKMSGGE